MLKKILLISTLVGPIFVAGISNAQEYDSKAINDQLAEILEPIVGDVLKRSNEQYTLHYDIIVEGRSEIISGSVGFFSSGNEVNSCIATGRDPVMEIYTPNSIYHWCASEQSGHYQQDWYSRSPVVSFRYEWDRPCPAPTGAEDACN